ncbi:MAG: hypothetical protein JXQ29_11925 [Planctomycetes bacterium]|nr:hypothetical protein [Planctomycetota bacterium]
MPAIILKAVCIAVLFCMLNGCAEIHVARNLNGQALGESGEPIAHVSATNWGYYLLAYIPLVAGSTENPGAIRFFSDTVEVDDLVTMVTRKSKELGGTHTTDMSSSVLSWWVNTIPILWLREAQVSANVLRK